MSEVITKACERPSCDNGNRYTLDQNGIITAIADCPDCSGTGRVPDVEATQRAQLDAQRILIERFESQLRTKESENAELRGEVARLRAVASDFAAEAQERASELCTARADVVRLTAEVERLKGREREAAAMMRNDEPGCWRCPACDKWAPDDASTRLAAWLAGCKS